MGNAAAVSVRPVALYAHRGQSQISVPYIDAAALAERSVEEVVWVTRGVVVGYRAADRKRTAIDCDASAV